MPHPVNDNDADPVEAAARAALCMLVGWPIASRTTGRIVERGVSDDPLLIVARTDGPGRSAIDHVVRSEQRCALRIHLSGGDRASIRRLDLIVPAEPARWFRRRRLWVTPLLDAAWLTDDPRGVTTTLPAFRFTAEGLEAHWMHPWADRQDREAGNRQADIAVSRLLAAFAAADAGR